MSSRDDADAGTVDDGSSAQSSAAALDGGQTCRDGTTCSRDDNSDSGSSSNGGAVSEVDASATDAASQGVPEDAMPSRGCSLGNATPALSLSYFSRDTTITLPEAYDGSTPLPIVLALHASGMWDEMGANFPEEHALRKNFIVVTPKSVQSSGGFENERQDEFTGLRTDLNDNFCFDTARFFSIGHASGARVAARLSTEDYQFRAIALVGAVAGSPDAIPTLFIHANEDNYSRPFNDIDGSTSAARFATRNGCSSDTLPFSSAEGSESSGSDTADCVDYQGCTQSLRWCRFDYVQTSSTFEYWPSFASDLVYDFFASVR